MDRPLVALTIGDPTGVGPEVIVRAWADARLHDVARCVVVGHPEMLRRAVRLVGSAARVEVVPSVRDIVASTDVIPCLAVGSDDVLDAPPATIDARGGQAAYDALVRAIDLARAGEVDAITTAPLNKAALWAAGHHYPGHTELLAERCGVEDYAMMLYLGPAAFGADMGWPGRSPRSPGASKTQPRPPDEDWPSDGMRPRDRLTGLGVVHVTLHLALRDVFANLSTGAIVAKGRLVAGVMRRLGVARPRIAVCALNPHAGEEGLFGDEERTTIAPAVERLRELGLDVAGPLPADTLMVRARDGEFDAIVAMYHDQGHIAVKLMGMGQAVNITLGLPIVRTSVAHGTAFDLAWQGKADHRSLVEAVVVAARLATAKSTPEPGA